MAFININFIGSFLWISFFFLNKVSEILLYCNLSIETAQSQSVHFAGSTFCIADMRFCFSTDKNQGSSRRGSSVSASQLAVFCSIVICLTIPSRTTVCSETGLTYRHFIPVSRFRIYFRNFRTKISCLRWSIDIKYLYS